LKPIQNVLDDTFFLNNLLFAAQLFKIEQIYTLFCSFIFSGVQRSGDARDDYLIGCPLPNSTIEQWRMVVIVTGHTLFVTSQCDVIFTFATLLTHAGLPDGPFHGQFQIIWPF